MNINNAIYAPLSTNIPVPVVVKFEIKQQSTNEVLYVANLPMSFNTESYEIKLGEAILMAIKDGVDLREANLIKAKLDSTTINGVDFRGVHNLNHANFIDANLTNVKLN